tara:strand:+ start:2609 stop:3385 length:777 start_codon:yes stop_codon:yes gene_type:complete
MNEDYKQHVHEALQKDIRLDGRKKDEFRKIKVEKGIISTAEGSAKVTCGDSEVLVGVKLSVGTPFPDTPKDGVVMVNAELLPLSNPRFESGPPSIESIEISRVIDRGIRESNSIDTKKLCIEKGEKVWMLNIDICPLNHDGNLFDLGALGAVAALSETFFPAYDKENGVNYKEKSKKKLPMNLIPVSVTVLKIGENLIVDPVENEECVIDARLTISFTEKGDLCAVQKGGDSSLSCEEISKMVDLAGKKAKELRKVLG